MKLKILYLAFFCALTLVLQQSCNTEPDNDCDVSYKDDIQPITVASCTGYCHHSSVYIEYEGIKQVVDSGELWEQVVSEKSMPPVDDLYTDLTEEERDLFACWIEAGAPNN